MSWLALSPAPPESTRTRAAPSFVLPYLSGGGTLSSDELRGKPVVLNFWASWCAPCREEARLLEHSFRRYRGEVVFVGVAVRDTRAAARDFVKEFRISYPVVIDPEQELAGDLGVKGLPQTFFIDEAWTLERSDAAASGDTDAVVLGPLTAAGLERRIDRLTAPPPGP